MIRRIEFTVDGDRVIGNLHRPDDGEGLPAVVVAGPMTSVKEQVAGVYAAALAQRGIAALAIDHRGFGQSEGAPRQYEDWRRKVRDLGEALTFLRTASSRINARRLGAVGVCLGCGYVAALASQDRRLQAVGFVAGYYRDPKMMRDTDPVGFDARIAEGIAARNIYEKSGELLLIPAASLHGDAAMQTTDTVEYYTRRAAVPNFQNAFATMSREVFLPFDVQEFARLLTVPATMIHSKKALSPQLAKRFYNNLAGPKRLHTLVSLGQTDFYDDPKLVAQSADILAAHLLATL
jgi:uncharacterized protein